MRLRTFLQALLDIDSFIALWHLNAICGPSVCHLCCVIDPVHWSSPPVAEMDLSVAAEADSINALCSQINSSFTKPSEDFSGQATSNGLPACSIPPAIPPPPVPQGQGETHNIISIADLKSKQKYSWCSKMDSWITNNWVIKLMRLLLSTRNSRSEWICDVICNRGLQQDQLLVQILYLDHVQIKIKNSK